jgi:hypothetical protein
LHIFSVDHEIAGRGPKIGERASARSPIFGYSLNFCEVLILQATLVKDTSRGGHYAPPRFLPVIVCFSIILWDFVDLPGASHLHFLKEMVLRYEQQLAIN